MILIEIFRKGSSFGELGIKYSQLRAATIIADSDCHMATIDSNNYNRVIMAYEKNVNECIYIITGTIKLFEICVDI